MENEVTHAASSSGGSLETSIIDKSLDKGFEYLDLIHTEAGMVALLLALFCIYLIWAVWRERRANHESTEKLYTLGIESTKATTQSNNTLEKIYQLLTFHKEP